MHQHCGYEGQQLYNASPKPTAPRGKWMEACRGRECPRSVSLQTSTNCRLGTRHLARVTVHARRTTSLAHLCKCHNSDCSNLPDYRMIADKDMTVAGGEQSRHYQKIVYHWFVVYH